MDKDTKLTQLLEYIFNLDYSLTASETMIVQKQRNELKYNLLEGFIDALVEAGLPSDLIHRTTDGYIFELQNLELGRIPVLIDIKVKNIGYPLEEAVQEWNDKVADKKAKEQKALREKQEKERKRKEKEHLQNLRRERVLKEYEEFKDKD